MAVQSLAFRVAAPLVAGQPPGLEVFSTDMPRPVPFQRWDADDGRLAKTSARFGGFLEGVCWCYQAGFNRANTSIVLGRWRVYATQRGSRAAQVSSEYPVVSSTKHAAQRVGRQGSGQQGGHGSCSPCVLHSIGGTLLAFVASNLPVSRMTCWVV